MENCNRCLEIEIRVLGHEHLDTATTQNNLGIVLTKQGKYPEALEMYDRCLKTREKVLGRNHPDVAATQDRIVLATQGKHLEALPAALKMLEKALKTRVAVLGPQHLETAKTQENINACNINAWNNT